MEKKIDLPIQVVSQRTGLSPHLIRIWEKRYQAVTPFRSKTKRRFYSEEDIERLHLLKVLTDGGHRISQVAQLPLGDLRNLNELLRKDLTPGQGASESAHSQTSVGLLEDCMQAIEALDSSGLDFCLARATMAMTPLAVIENLIIPLLKHIGDRQRQGKLRIVHAQFAFAIIRPFLVSSFKAYDIPPNAPLLVTATPAGQLHEFGALFFMTAAAACGWRSTYLGSNLPMEEIAAGVHQLGAKLVAMSIVYPKGDPLLHNDLLRLRRLLPETTAIVVGGEGADSYVRALTAIGASLISKLSEFQDILDASLQLASPAPESAS